MSLSSTIARTLAWNPHKDKNPRSRTPSYNPHIRNRNPEFPRVEPMPNIKEIGNPRNGTELMRVKGKLRSERIVTIGFQPRGEGIHEIPAVG